MALLKNINSKSKAFLNSGFGTSASSYGGRFVNKNGTANIEKRGVPILHRISWYHTMIDMATWKFMLVILSFFIGINFVFALIYYAIGTEHLNGINPSDSVWVQFGQAYFFSSQTFTTVGYGHISPKGFLASSISCQ